MNASDSNLPNRNTAGRQAVIVAGSNHASINTGTQIFLTIIRQGEQPGAGTEELRRAYLAWLGLRANELPLLAGESKEQQVQLSSLYTALLTQGQERAEMDSGPARNPGRLRHSDEAGRLSALEALDQSRCLVLMGGPGSGKSTFLNFVALCMAGELLGQPPANLALLCAPLPADPDKPGNKPIPQRWRHGALLPVRVVLRDFAASLLPAGQPVGADALWRFIVGQLPEQFRRYAEALQAELLGQGGLILLDGLDEVPDALRRREQVKQAVQEFAGMYRNCRFLVTSRTYAYQRQDWKLNGFAERELLPFSRGQIERFIETWYAHMAQLFLLTATDAQARAEALKRATRRPELRELAGQPLLLTLMARLQRRVGGSLPENREALYSQSVAMLLEEWEGLKLKRGTNNQPVVEPSLSEWLNASGENIRRELDKLAYHAHLNQPDLDGTADIRQEEVIAALVAASRERIDTRILRLEEYLRDRSGLLNSHGEGLYQFPHRSFQEYLAACHLARHDFPDTLSRLATTEPGRWREVLLLAAARTREVPFAFWALVEELCPEKAPGENAPQADSETQWGALLAGQVLVETGLAGPNPELPSRDEKKRQRVRGWQLRLLTSTVLPARERALAGDLLAAMDDPRAHLLDVDRMRFCAVPAGPFWMGEKGNKDAELHLNEALDYPYWIARAPVTVAQFRQFVEGSSYRQGAPASLKDAGNRPVAGVSWHDAQAFCAWLNRRWGDRLPSGWRVMLPSEAEWEKAVRGGLRIPRAVRVAEAGPGCSAMAGDACDNPLPQRAWPWGDEEDAGRFNAEGSVGHASTPGCFAAGISPYGCEDMAGNVWEWTRSLWGKDWRKPDFSYPYGPDKDGREEIEAGDEVFRVVRGGSWYSPRVNARCAFRLGDRPDDRFDFLGFRVVLCSSPVGCP